MFFVVQSNDSFNFPLGWIKYIVIDIIVIIVVCFRVVHGIDGSVEETLCMKRKSKKRPQKQFFTHILEREMQTTEVSKKLQPVRTLQSIFRAKNSKYDSAPQNKVEQRITTQLDFEHNRQNNLWRTPFDDEKYLQLQSDEATGIYLNANIKT